MFCLSTVIWSVLCLACIPYLVLVQVSRYRYSAVCIVSVVKHTVYDSLISVTNSASYEM
jgi:hypothetical protein